LPWSVRALNRATLARQLLLERRPVGIVEAVRQIVAVQAQEPASPYLALWNRITDFDPAHLDAAYARRAVVKASLMRVTLHVVTATDYPDFHHAVERSLRAFRLSDRRFAELGLSADEIADLLPALLDFAAEPRTNAECQAMLDARMGIRPEPGLWWALRPFAPLIHAPTGGPWSFGPRPSYLSGRTGAPPADRAESLRRLTVRYLEGFGPASVADIAQFTRLPRTAVREALTSLVGELERLDGPEGVELVDRPGQPRPAEDTPAPPRLLGMWDSLLLAYADRSRTTPPDYRKVVTRTNGDLLSTLLVDGLVAGVWRPVDGAIEASAFHPLTEAAWAGLEVEARSLLRLLGTRDPDVYRRYRRWWAQLPGAEVRRLGS